MKEQNWTLKLIVLFSGILGALLLFQIFYIAPNIRNQEIKKTEIYHEEIVRNIAREWDTDIFQTLGRAEALAERDDFRRMDIPAIQKITDVIVEGSYRFESLSILNSEGWFLYGTMEDFSLYTTKSYADRPYFSVPFDDGKTYFTPPSYYAKENLVAASLSIPIESETGERIGVLIAGMGLNHVIETLQKYPFREGEVAYIVDNDGTVIAHSKIDIFTLKDGPLSLSYGEWPMVQAVMNGEKGSFQKYRHDDKSYFGTHAILESNGWGVIVKIEMKSFLAEVNSMAWQLLLVNLFLFAIAMLLMLIFTRQITSSQREAEKALQESELKFRTLLTNINDLVIEMDSEGKFTYVSPQIFDIFGYTQEESVRLTAFDFVHPDDIEKAMKAIETMDEEKHLEYRSRHKDGHYVHVSTSGKVVPDGAGGFKIVSVLRDVTLRKEAEEKLQEFERRYSALFNSSNDGVAILNLDGVHIAVNERFVDMLGYDSAELIGKETKKTVAPFEYTKSREKMKSLLAGEAIPLYERIFKAKDGTLIPAEINLTLVRDVQGKPVYFQSIVRDISERKRMEKALRDSEERYRELVEKADIAILVDDEEGKIVYANKKAAELYGYSVDEMKERTIQSLVHPDDTKKVLKYHKRRIQGMDVPSNYVFKALRKDGSLRFFEMYAASHGKRKELAGTRMYIKDITERKQEEEERTRLQARLMQSEKMAGIGTLTSGIAHEFNNLLQIMSGNVELAQKTKSPEDMAEALDIVADISDRTTKIIRDLLIFSRQDTSEKEPYDVTEAIESVLSLTEEQIKKHNIEVVRRYEETHQVNVNKGEIQQVFLNIVTNARDAMMSSGGIMRIDVRARDGNVEVRFEDTGEGIEERDLGRVFEPFYTTKGAIGGSTAVSGSGLGLSVSYGIVKRHGGEIEVESRKGEGTVFTVRLPVGGEV